MKKLLFAGIVTLALVSCKSKDQNKTSDTKSVVNSKDSTLVTDSSWGLINASSNIDSLKASYGVANLKDERICGPECADSIDVTFVYHNTPKELIVHWRDSSYHQKIELIETYAEGSPYRTSKGLHIGSTLRDIQLAYPGKITFSGFGWDYGGYIGSFAAGDLGSLPIGFRLDLKEYNGSLDSLYGDRELNTDMPVVKNNLDKIIVSTLTLSLNRPQ